MHARPFYNNPTTSETTQIPEYHMVEQIDLAVTETHLAVDSEADI